MKNGGEWPPQASVRLGLLGLQKLVLLPERLGWERTASTHIWAQHPQLDWGFGARAQLVVVPAMPLSEAQALGVALGAAHTQESHVVILFSRFLVSPPLPQAHTKPSYSFSTTEPSGKENSLMPTE